MSGWIKFEKDLLTDPRIIRIARELRRIVTACNGGALHPETLLYGALIRIWCLADSHVDEQDILPLGCRELDEFVGIEGFCALLPSDWLVEIDENHVQLPNFHAHNGTEAKTKAMTQRRVERFRDQEKRTTVTTCNGPALPDQDLDQDHKEKEDVVVPESIQRDAWDEWIAFRRQRKWPQSPMALTKQLKLLAKYDADTQREIIETSINAGWQGLFAPKGKKPTAGDSGWR